MSFSIRVNHDKQLLYVHGEGMITADDIDKYYPTLKATKGVEVCTKALVNLSSMGVSLKHAPITHIKSLGLMFQHSPALPAGAKMAITVRSTLAFGFVRLFMGSRGDRLTIRPFKKMEDAWAWLEVLPEDIPSMEDTSSP